MTTESVLVKAIYSFKGKNNDELCFKKGDIITVTQKEEGGWWEGTLGETTGWFPSNYVTEFKGKQNQKCVYISVYVASCFMINRYLTSYFCYNSSSDSKYGFII